MKFCSGGGKHKRKRPYDTQEDANEAVAQAVILANRLRPYICKTCNKYHLTTQGYTTEELMDYRIHGREHDPRYKDENKT